MKKTLFIAFVFALISLSNSVNAQLKKVYNDDIDPMEQIDKAIVQANEQGKFVICQVGGNWCPWCLRFADFITKDEEIAKFIDENFVYIHVSYNPHKSTDEARDKAMLKRLGNPGRKTRATSKRARAITRIKYCNSSCTGLLRLLMLNDG